MTLSLKERLALIKANKTAPTTGEAPVTAPVPAVVETVEETVEKAVIEVKAVVEKKEEKKEVKNPLLAELQTKRSLGTISFKEKLTLARLEKDYNHAHPVEEQKDEPANLPDVPEKGTVSKKESETVQRSPDLHSSQPDTEARATELVDPEYTEYLSLLEKEAASSIKLLEKMKLNKLKVKFALPPIDVPDREIKTVVEAVEAPAVEEKKVEAEAKAIDELTDQMKADVDTAYKKLSLKERIALKKMLQEQASLAEDVEDTLTSSLEKDIPANAVVNTVGTDTSPKKHETFSTNITLNARQLMAKEMAEAGKSFCLIGAAGTGKTSTQRDVAKSLWQSGALRMTEFKISGGGGARVQAPSIAFCAYTRRASSNLARAIHKDPDLCEVFKDNIMTVHALLEFEPENFYDAEKDKESMRFVPRRTAANPLEITHLVIEEASMLGLDLWTLLYDALPVGVQIIFIGDINQLPPVFGLSILNYALVQLPVVELTEVYRQAGDSMVLANAHNILKGKNLEEGKGFSIIRGKNPVQVGQAKMGQVLASMFKALFDNGEYDPEDCIILSPFNKQDLGTDMMNKHIAQFLGAHRDAEVYEVLAGVNKHYLAIGDKVMYNKQDGVIESISRNGLYHGREPQLHGKDLTRFGVRILGMESTHLDIDEEATLDYSTFNIDELAEQGAERKQQASHVVTIRMETGLTATLDSAGDFSGQVFSLGYVLTVHKAQGCEWRKVYGILHRDHAVMLNRELFYTLVTRAREEVVLIAKDTVLEKAIRTQKIKGDTLQDKIEYFNSGAIDVNAVACTKG